jgi:hypothetical protein
MTIDTKPLSERLRYTAQINRSRGLLDAHPWVGELDLAADALDAKDARIAALTRELSAACGYMRNAKIDLETGATKATAIRTIEGGLRRAEAALRTQESSNDQ